MSSNGLAVVYSSDCPSSLQRVAVDNVTVFGCDGTADDVQINAAINAVAATGQTASTPPTGGGGRVELVGFNFNLANKIVQQSWVDLSGVFGWAGTAINLSSGFTDTAMIDMGQTYTELMAIHGLRLNGKNIGTAVPGIHLAGQTTQTPFTYSDPRYKIYDCWIDQFTGAGIATITSNRSSHIYDLHVTRNAGWGIDGTGLVDSVVHNIEMEGNGTSGTSGGLYAGNVSTTYTHIRIYNSHGYGIQSDATRLQWTNCAVVDSSLHNWYLTTGKVSLSGCHSDSASLGNTNVNDGFHIGSGSGLSFVTMDKACQSYDRNGTPHQRYGVYLDGSCTNCRIDCATYGNATGSFGGSTSPGAGSVYDVYGT